MASTASVHAWGEAGAGGRRRMEIWLSFGQMEEGKDEDW